jgi:hypothetical protein
VEAVRGIHHDAVQEIFQIGLSIQSTAARHALSDRLQRQVDELVVALDSVVRASQRAAYELGPVQDAGATSDGRPLGRTTTDLARSVSPLCLVRGC